MSAKAIEDGVNEGVGKKKKNISRKKDFYTALPS